MLIKRQYIIFFMYLFNQAKQIIPKPKAKTKVSQMRANLDFNIFKILPQKHKIILLLPDCNICLIFSLAMLYNNIKYKGKYRGF